MVQVASKGDLEVERKVISVSVKRQLTIPQKYFEILGLGNEVECILQEGGLFIRSVRNTGGGEFSEEILADLIAQGFSGSELLEKFKAHSKKMRPAIEKMIAEADDFAASGKGKLSMEELFGKEA